MSDSSSSEKGPEPYVPSVFSQEDREQQDLVATTEELERSLTRTSSIKTPGSDEYAVTKEGFLTVPLSSPRHPWSWSVPYRIFSTCVYGITTCGVQMTTSYITGGIPQLAEHFHVGTEVAVFAFSVFILGNMVGAVLLTPLSETYGRKAAIFGTNFICGYIICQTANVDSIAAFTIYRFIAGVFGGCPLAAGPSAMADVWSPAVRVVAMMLYGAMIILGSTSSPVFEALLVTNDPGYGLQWGAWFTGIFQMAWSIFGFLTVRESFVLLIEQNIAVDLKLTTERWNVHCLLDRWRITPRDFLLTHVMRPIKLFFMPTMLCYNTLSSFVYGLYFLLISTVPEQFELIHKFELAPANATLFSLLVGWVCGGFIMLGVSINMGKYAKRMQRPPPPEMVLPAMMGGIPILSAGCFLYGWGFYRFVHWIVPCVGLWMVGIGFCLVFGTSLIYIVLCYTTPRASYAASAIGANMVLRSALGGSFPLFASQMYHTLDVHWASSLLGFLLAAATPIPFIFYFYGAKIRAGDSMRREMEAI